MQVRMRRHRCAIAAGGRCGNRSGPGIAAHGDSGSRPAAGGRGRVVHSKPTAARAKTADADEDAAANATFRRTNDRNKERWCFVGERVRRDECHVRPVFQGPGGLPFRTKRQEQKLLRRNRIARHDRRIHETGARPGFRPDARLSRQAVALPTAPGLCVAQGPGNRQDVGRGGRPPGAGAAERPHRGGGCAPQHQPQGSQQQQRRKRKRKRRDRAPMGRRVSDRILCGSEIWNGWSSLRASPPGLQLHQRPCGTGRREH
mmetsp:Transcript_6669/g.19239  ORF Transcript_6669/g.19239 Transcript_6669/m.19239 type:complete len:259 (-) Transcript_6669:540-1316(-)